MLFEIVTAATRLMPLHENARSTARAAMVRDGHVAGIPDLAPLQVDAQAEVGVIDVKEEVAVHSAKLLETRARNHHESAAHNGYPCRFMERRFTKKMMPFEVGMIGKQ